MTLAYIQSSGGLEVASKSPVLCSVSQVLAIQFNFNSISIQFQFNFNSISIQLACEYSRLSFARATTCESRRVTLGNSHVVAGANERRLYSQATQVSDLASSKRLL